MDENQKLIIEVKQAHHDKTAIEKYHRVGAGAYLKDMVYGAIDGIVTTFAVVAGVAGAGLSIKVILILGFANLVADGLSMATGNYLGTKSENEFQRKERAMEEWEVDNVPEEETKEIEEIYRAKGFRGDDLRRAVSVISKNKKVWVDEMMIYELGMAPGESENPLKKGLATFSAFVIAGFLPLAPYVFGIGITSSFVTAIIMSAIALFAVGALRSLFIKKSWAVAGLEMLGVGAIASIVAYVIGAWIERLV